MPSSAAVLDRLTRITVQVVGCAPEAVVPSARLAKDLGVDSLSLVEISEQLGHSFDLYLADETINQLVTVQDTITAIVDHDPKVTAPANPATAGSVARFATTGEAFRPVVPRSPSNLTDQQLAERKTLAKKFAWGFAIVGIAIGLIFGLSAVLVVDASGIKDVSLPDTPTPTAAKTPTATPSPTPTANPTAEATPKPTLVAESTSIAPGERLRLTGEFPGADKGATIQVQVKDAGESWENFPVTTRTDDAGKFRTVIFTTRTGEREFRMLNKNTNESTPAVKISIG